MFLLKERIWLSVSIFLLAGFSSGYAQRAVNSNLLQSLSNQQATISLSAVPLGLIGVNDVVTVSWTPASQCELRYSLVPGGGILANYSSIFPSQDLQTNITGQLTFLGEKFSTGIFYCIITNGSDYSTEFIIIREADVSARMITPRSARGEEGINTNSPTFSWEAVNAVPFYHLILSDQPFEVIEDENGGTNTEGANIIWQAISSETSIPYGTPDPSGYFTTTSPPPLVNGVRYNWIVLNNFGNNPALTSSVTSGPTGFEVGVPPPFEPPEIILPTQGAIITANTITFEWGEVEGASLYHLYLSRFEDIRGSKGLLPIWDGVTSNTLFDLSASVLQQEGTYYWKVLAQDEDGSGAITDTSAFYFSTRSAHVNFYTVDLQGSVIPRSNLYLESAANGTSPQVLPANDGGLFERDLPLGSYEVTARKEGFEDTTLVFELQIENEIRQINIPMRQSPSTIYGSTRNSSQSALGFVDVKAVSQSTGETKETTSDINGNFSLSLTSDNWTLYATKNGFSSATPRSLFLDADVNLNLDSDANGGSLILAKHTHSVSGFILTPSGEPIWGATLIATKDDDEEQIVTNAQGQYALTLGPGTWMVEANKEGYVSPQPEEVDIIDHNVSLDLMLSPKANIISGTVTSGGVAVKDAEVQAIPNSGATKSVLTNAYGQYTISLGQGTYQIVPEKNGYVSPEPSDFSLTVGHTLSGVDFVLQPQTSFINGEVTSNGQPLEGVTISNGSETTTSGANGHYSLGVLHGNYTVSAIKQGYLSDESKSVTLTPGQTLSGIDFILTPNASIITGTIKNGSLPVSSANVIATNTANGNVFSTGTDDLGYYSFSVSTGSYTLEANKTGFIANPEQLNVVINPGQTIPNNDFSFVENLSYISGLIKNASAPLRNATVLVTAVDAEENSFSTVTGVDGTFNVSVLPGYSYHVKGRKTGYIDQTTTTTTLSISAQSNLTLVLTQQQSLIDGKVTTQSGSILSDASVEASDGTSNFTTGTDASGNYALGLDAGTYDVTVRKTGYLPSTRELSVGLGDTLSASTFKLTPNFSTLDGIITDNSTDALVKNALVVATESGSHAGGSAYTGSQGHYLMQNLPVGVYTITITHPSYETKIIENKVFAGGSSNRIDTKLIPQNGKISGKVTSSGVGISGVTVTASKSGVSESVVTVSDGSYAIENLAPGSYTVQSSLTGYSSSSSQVADVLSNENVTANFTATPNEGKIKGKLSEAGSGLAGAQVLAIGSSGNSGFTTSGADGTYAISNLATDEYRVYVKLDRYVSTPDTAAIALGPGDTLTADFQMVKSEIKITGVVRDQLNSPLNGIVVSAQSSKGIGETTTNSDGSFELTELPANAQYQLKTVTFHEGYDNDEIMLSVGTSDVGGRELTVDIHTSKIRGNVGIAGATITAHNSDRDITKTTTSQPDGSFLLKNLFNGSFEITASKLGHKPNPSNRAVSDVGIGEERSGVDFELTEINVAISGVVNDQGGSPLPNITVFASSGEISGNTTTNSSGEYQITGLAPNLTYAVQTKLPASDYENGKLNVDIGESDVAEQNLLVQVHNSVIQGNVTTTSSAPVASVLVTIVELDSLTYTNDTGFYKFEHLFADSYTISVSKEGYESQTQTSVTVGQTQTQIQDFTGLTPLTSAISGIVTQEDERLKNVVVSLIEEATASVQARDTTNAGGIYIFNNLDVNQSYTVEAYKKGYSRKSITGQSPPDNDLLSVDFSLTPVANSIYGLVTDAATGKAQAGALVTVNGISGGTWHDSTNTFGLFSIRGLAQGSYSILAEEQNLISPSQTVGLTAGQAIKLNLELEEAGIINGLVTYLGNGRAGANITATNSLYGIAVSTASASDGSYSLKGLLNGEYTVSCLVNGFSVSPSQQTITITNGETANANFSLSAESNAILGIVTDPEGDLLAGAKILVSGSNAQDSAATDLNGQFQITDLPDGEYNVSVSLAGFNALSNEGVSVLGGQPVVIDFELTQIHNSISGFVRNSVTSAGISNAVVTADFNSTIYNTTTGNDGSYLFEMDSAGTYLLSADKNSYTESGSFEVELKQGKSASLNLSLTPIFTTSSISGVVSRKNELVKGAQIICTSLSDVSVRDTVLTDVNGTYGLVGLPAPAEYLLEASMGDYGILSSPVLSLTESGIDYNFIFPGGSIKWIITRDGTKPLPGIKVKLINNTQQITLLTNSNGFSETDDNLTRGSYAVTFEAGANTILPKNYTVELEEDSSTVMEELQLPFIHVPPDSVAAEERMDIRMMVFTTQINPIWISYKGKNDIAYQKLQLQHEPALSSVDTAYYVTSIPSQGSPGEISYYFETEYQEHTYSNETKPLKGIVTAEGIFSSVSVTPAAKSVQPGTPVLLHVRAYDGIKKTLSPHDVDWEIIEGIGTLSEFSKDSTKVWFTSDIDTTSKIRARIEHSGIVISKTMSVETRARVLETLELGSSVLESSNRDEVIFSYAAADTGGTVMSIFPVWDFSPRTSGQLIPSEDMESVTLKPDSNFVGQIHVFVRDSLTGTEAYFNAAEGTNTGDTGLKVYQLITSQSPEVEVNDGAGFNLIVPTGAAAAGSQLRVKLRKPQIPDVKRFTGKYTVSGSIYDINVSGTISTGTQFGLTLPITDAEKDNLIVGHWDANGLNWSEVTSEQNGTSLRAMTTHFSEFAVLKQSDPLGIRNLALLPNPFTAYDPYGLQIGFSLSSDDIRKPWVTVKIYNMRGDLVRTIADNLPMSPIEYQPGDAETLMWDGRTDAGTLARNGRYIVRIKVEDSTGTKEKIKTVVLIK